MSFFELDGGAKARKSKPKPKATKKASGMKKTKKTKKGGNFLGTVSELFAPAGWENFVTAAGLLALDRTDNYLRKSKDSKKQKGGADDTPYEETDTDTMTGGARKRSSSRKQRGGSDGHHTVEYLDAVGGEDDTTSQTGGAKKKTKSKTRSRSSSRSKKVKKTVRKHKGGAMTDDEKRTFITSYHQEPETKQLIDIYNSVSSNNSIQNNNQSTRGNKIISKVIETHSQSLAPTPIGNNVTLSMQQQANAQQAAQPAAQPENSLFGGKKSKSKPKSKSSSKKSKSSSKKPKAKKPKTKGRK